MATPRIVPSYTSMVLLSLSEHVNLAMFHMKQSNNSKKGELHGIIRSKGETI